MKRNHFNNSNTLRSSLLCWTLVISLIIQFVNAFNSATVNTNSVGQHNVAVTPSDVDIFHDDNVQNGVKSFVDSTFPSSYMKENKQLNLRSNNIQETDERYSNSATSSKSLRSEEEKRISYFKSSAATLSEKQHHFHVSKEKVHSDTYDNSVMSDILLRVKDHLQRHLRKHQHEASPVNELLGSSVTDYSEHISSANNLFKGQPSIPSIGSTYGEEKQLRIDYFRTSAARLIEQQKQKQQRLLGRSLESATDTKMAYLQAKKSLNRKQKNRQNKIYHMIQSPSTTLATLTSEFVAKTKDQIVEAANDSKEFLEEMLKGATTGSADNLAITDDRNAYTEQEYIDTESPEMWKQQEHFRSNSFVKSRRPSLMKEGKQMTSTVGAEGGVALPSSVVVQQGKSYYFSSKPNEKKVNDTSEQLFEKAYYGSREEEKSHYAYTSGIEPNNNVNMNKKEEVHQKERLRMKMNKTPQPPSTLPSLQKIELMALALAPSVVTTRSSYDKTKKRPLYYYMIKDKKERTGNDIVVPGCIRRSDKQGMFQKKEEIIISKSQQHDNHQQEHNRANRHSHSEQSQTFEPEPGKPIAFRDGDDSNWLHNGMLP